MALALAALTLLTFCGVWRNGFVEYDDAIYIYQNPYVQQGLGTEAVAFAFNSGYGNNWHPLTWLSHALDCQLYGLNPAGHHVTSLFLHIVNVVLLFLLLRRLTGALWRSALVAALFGVHPLHVESVAWAAERKDVLSAFFFMLTLLAYASYVKAKVADQAHSTTQQPSNSSKQDSPSPASFWYWVALVLFALGLMSKPMLVTLPFVLLLLDYWPLGRFSLDAANSSLSAAAEAQGPASRAQSSAVLPLIVEKIPFFLLTLVSCFLTLGAQGSAVLPFEAKPLPERLSDAALAGIAYLEQMFWPAHLSVFYPRPAVAAAMGGVTAILLLVAVSTLALWLSRRHRYFAVGWFWYLGMLVPVIGIVQVGSQAQADRYSYLPSIGAFILVVWGLGSLLPKMQNRVGGAGASTSALRWPLALGAGVVLTALGVTAHRQLAVWRDTEALFTHAAKVTRNNYVAVTSLANLKLNRGRAAEALTNVEEVLQYAPQHPMAQYVAGAALQMLGRNPEALPHFLAIPDEAGPELLLPKNARLVLCFLEAGRWTDAHTALTFVLTVRPGEPNALLLQAALLRAQGLVNEAVQVFRQALERKPSLSADNPTLNFELAELYCLVGRTREAVGCYAKVLEALPQSVRALNNYAWLLATDPNDQVRDGARAVELAERACRLTEWKQPVLMGSLAAAYAEANRFDDAVQMAERARDQAKASQLEDVAKRNAELLELYRQHKSYREKGS